MLSRRDRWTIVAGVGLGTFLAALDITVVGTIMPTVVASLGGFNLYSWVFSAYMVAATATLPLFGKLSDIYGRRKLYGIAIGFFILGSALCGASQNMTQLILFRAIQGIGAGGIYALSFTIIGLVFPLTERGQIQGLVSSIWAVASILGPLLGGFLVDTIGWRWAFYINLWPGVLAAILVFVSLRESPSDLARSRSIDFLGAVVLTGGVVALLLGVLEAGAGSSWTSPSVFVPATIALILFAALIWVEGGAEEPIVPLALFRRRTFSVSNAGNFLAGMAHFGSTVFVPPFVQGVLGGSATRAGVALMPSSLGWSLGSVAGGRALNRLGYRALVVAGMAIMAVGFVLLSRMGLSTGQSEAMRNTFILGLGMGLIAPTLTVAVQSSAERGQLGVATSSVQFFRLIGGALGTSIMGSVMASQMRVYTREILSPESLSRLGLESLPSGIDVQTILRPEGASSLPSSLLIPLRQALSDSISAVFVVALVTILIGLVVGFMMPSGSPARQEAGADGN